MKIGELKFKRRYSAAQVIVDIFSLAALLYLCYTVYVCSMDISRLNALNQTNSDLSFMDWKPLIIWIVAAVVVCGVSVFLLFKSRKKPKKLFINENNVVKYCNIIDTCISCLRLLILLALCEGCYLHMAAILMRNAGFSVQLLCDLAIAVFVVLFTRLRLEAISDTEREKAEEKEKKKTIVED
ncbi:MAG: hypothetical protein ACI4J4_11250 [Ruminiclostridium sp.]